MASAVDICNLALSRLGDAATIASLDPPEGSAQAEHCARFYPIALNSLLELHTWGFATRRVTLAKLDVESWNWTYAYARPSGAVRLLAVLPASASPDEEGEPFDTESNGSGTGMILSNLEDATLRYTCLISDTTKFPPLFVDALSWLLASHLAGPIIKGDAGKAEAKACLQAFNLVVAQAKASDANQRKVTTEHKPAWIGGR